METAIIGLISSVIVGMLSLVGVIYTNSQSNKKVEHQILTAQAVTDTKIQNLTDEVKKHNNFANRIPVIEEQIKVINHRIDDLEDK
jgi:predicted RND superfamily exporter protein